MKEALCASVQGAGSVADAVVRLLFCSALRSFASGRSREVMDVQRSVRRFSLGDRITVV